MVETISIVTRDRPTDFLKGVTQGEPQTIQVVDCFDLLINLREKIEKDLTCQQQIIYQTLTSKSLCEIKTGTELIPEPEQVYEQRLPQVEQ